ncbi:unnamed protein product [Rhizophagus irregularis]|uniref:Uncharacterized protein n=1 Tax=Rhizophagus irregularis TaxID=588596 RepID=A0A916E2C5_9GLOM|nr:unnamed protein product [Rhizophagus irregularis]
MGFLNECTIEPLRNKIGQYPTSLENISTEKGERRDKAQQLYNQYKKITYLTFLDTRPDRALARKWDSNRSRNQFHIHQPTFTNDGTNNDNYGQKKINEIFSFFCDITHENNNSDYVKKYPFRQVLQRNKRYFIIIILKIPKRIPSPPYWGILGLTRQHKLTKNKLITIWSLDPYQDKFRKYWSEQQLTASRERRKEANKERARIRQKTDIIIELLTGPALICEVSGGLPAGTYKLHESHSVWLSSNWFTVALPASANKLPAYEAVHIMFIRFLEHRLSKLTDYCTKLKVE